MASQPRERSRSRDIPRDPLAVISPEVRPATNMDVAQLRWQAQDLFGAMECLGREVRALSERLGRLTAMVVQALGMLLLTQSR